MTNVIVLVLWRVAPQNFMVLNFMMSVQHIKCGLLYTMITSAFSHIIVGHLISNMLILSIFGTRIARKFGPKYLLKLYLGGAIGGSMGFLVYQAFIAPLVEVKQAEIRHSDLQGLGASAAVGAIMVHDILLLPPVGALLGGVFLIGMEMLSRWTLLIKIYGMPPNMRLEWEWEKKENAGARAHLGGAAAGGLAWLWKRKGRFGRF
ncbi:RHOMBOID-like protein 12, mitochondrial isoform X3 [Salvia miltiorrhiza]|nr:RHOMBOID-like protein 12, mitochondrial isoform X3 [Salvia miltiorrhiza]XP_057791825.1 RHOMBOID-like protein 12, mitochondrial isoform X3 [Salvia miltiorrhiza]